MWCELNHSTGVDAVHERGVARFEPPIRPGSRISVGGTMSSRGERRRSKAHDRRKKKEKRLRTLHILQYHRRLWIPGSNPIRSRARRIKPNFDKGRLEHAMPFACNSAQIVELRNALQLARSPETTPVNVELCNTLLPIALTHHRGWCGYADAHPMSSP